MLTERAILDALARDRVLIGAKSVLHKYSSCSLAWSDLRNMTCFHHGSDPSKTAKAEAETFGWRFSKNLWSWL